MFDENYIIELVKKAKGSASRMRILSTREKNTILKNLIGLIKNNSDKILSENQKDLTGGRKNGISSALLDRLKLNEGRIQDIARGVEDIIQLADPVGGTTPFRLLENGIRLGQVNVPLGVVAVIYESRPNVTIDVASLCIKSGNVAILKGGREAFYSNKIFYELLKEAFHKSNFDPYLFFVEKTERAYVNELLKQDKYIDVVIPRGGYDLVRAVSENSSIPVIKHDAGICHIYVASDADLGMAREIVINAKTQRPGTCNAVETLLIDKNFGFTPELIKSIQKEGVKIKGCVNAKKIVPDIELALPEDYHTEWLDLILSLKIVENLDEATKHIEDHSSSHSEGIITNDYQKIADFSNKVDSAALFINCSTKFHDGGQFGLGAEVGISTQKLHVRGPMGLEHLTCKKYIALGNGQVRK